MDNDYVPIPSPKEEFELFGWMHCLVTLDVCIVNHGIKFCDKEGYDIILVHMVNVLTIQNEEHLALESSIDTSLEAEVRHVQVENKISTFELSFGHETQRENYYDASYELKELHPLEIPKTQNQPIIFKTQEGKEIELP